MYIQICTLIHTCVHTVICMCTYDCVHSKQSLPTILQFRHLTVLGTNLNQTNVLDWICTVRYSEFWFSQVGNMGFSEGSEFCLEGLGFSFVWISELCWTSLHYISVDWKEKLYSVPAYDCQCDCQSQDCSMWWQRPVTLAVAGSHMCDL